MRREEDFLQGRMKHLVVSAGKVPDLHSKRGGSSVMVSRQRAGICLGDRESDFTCRVHGLFFALCKEKQDTEDK